MDTTRKNARFKVPLLLDSLLVIVLLLRVPLLLLLPMSHSFFFFFPLLLVPLFLLLLLPVPLLLLLQNPNRVTGGQRVLRGVGRRGGQAHAPRQLDLSDSGFGVWELDPSGSAIGLVGSRFLVGRVG